jgi:hypothetical protein
MSTCALCKQPPWHPSMDAGCGCNCTYEEMEAALRASTVYAVELRRALEWAAVEVISIVGIVGCKLCAAEEGPNGLVHAASCVLAKNPNPAGQLSGESSGSQATEDSRAGRAGTVIEGVVATQSPAPFAGRASAMASPPIRYTNQGASVRAAARRSRQAT